MKLFGIIAEVITTYPDYLIDNRPGSSFLNFRKEPNSMVLQFIDYLAVNFQQAAIGGADQIRDTGNTLRTPQSNAPQFQTNAAATDDSYGLWVGTGSTPVTLTDYTLDTKIAHGNGAGQLEYGAVSITAPTTTGTTRHFTASRVFTNNSGAGITINEYGWIFNSRYTTGTGHYLGERSLDSWLVADTASTTLTYTIGITV